MHFVLRFAILVVLVLGTVVLAEEAPQSSSNPLPPNVLLTVKKKCQRRENVTEAVQEEKTEATPVLTPAEIEEQCNRTTEYKTYMECLQHYEILKTRSKRNAMINADDCDYDDCDDEYEDCGSCTNTCRSCNSRSSCSGCSSCSKCKSRPCCVRQCHQKCASSVCRVNCKQDCYDRVNENVARGGGDRVNENVNSSNVLGGSATANATNLIDQAINITTVIKFNNLINTSNTVDIPITVNNTNINNITLTQTEVQRSDSSVIGPEVPLNTTTTSGPCCHIIYPRECHTTTEYPFKRCFHRRRRFCGPKCVPYQNGNITLPSLPNPSPQPPVQPIPSPQPQPIPMPSPCSQQQQWMIPQPMPMMPQVYQPQYMQPQFFQPQYIPQPFMQQPQFVIQQQPQPVIQQQPPLQSQQETTHVIQQHPLPIMQQQPQIILDSQLTQQPIFQSPCQQRPGGCGMMPVPPVQYYPPSVAPPCNQGCIPAQGAYSYPGYDYYLAQGAVQNQVQNHPQLQGNQNIPAS